MNFVSHAGPVRKQEDNVTQDSETEAHFNEDIEWKPKHKSMQFLRVRGLTVQ